MRRFVPFGLVAASLLLVAPGRAQLNGSHTLGDFGVQSGTQPRPGLYAAFFYYRYPTDAVLDADGDRLVPSAGSDAEIAITAFAPLIWYVSDLEILGANYGAYVVLPWTNGSLEAPGLDLDETSSTKFSDILLRPLDLGWHTDRVDVSAGFQLYAPTGRYEQGRRGNSGRGMWTWEPFVGATVFFDEARSLSLATTAYLEFHGEKEDTDVQVGEILSLQGGVGKSFLGGGLIVGAAYYAQWKLSEDRLGTFELPGGGTADVGLTGKHRVYGFGPDVTVPIATKSKLFALVNVRYFWETGVRSKTDGSSLIVTATFPVPSVRLQ